MKNTISNFKCPVCSLELKLQSNSHICKNNHTFDISKNGYVNLLMVNQKRSKTPGDNDEMIKSRNAFLSKGYYSSLSTQLNSMLYESFPLEKQSLLDVGCGTGYYLFGLRNYLKENNHVELYGIDISKPAIQLAAKFKMGANLAVASAFNLPFLDEVFDLLYSVFSPISPDESARVLKENGYIILVGPGEEHLSGLTKHIYDTSIPHGGNQVLDNSDVFEHITTLELKENIVVQKEDILNLVKMTPYYWQMTKEQIDAISLLDKVETVIHFYIKKYRKKAI